VSCLDGLGCSDGLAELLAGPEAAGADDEQPAIRKTIATVETARARRAFMFVTLTRRAESPMSWL
jgi:hypothetical protein